MAQLYYANLGSVDPERLRSAARAGLQDFHDYLKHTLDALNDPRSALRLGWEPIDPSAGPIRGSVWVRLVAPRDRSEEPDRTFEEFLDEEVSEVVELAIRGDRTVPTGRPASFAAAARIKVLDRDPDGYRLLLARQPIQPELAISPNTTTLDRQLTTVRQLRDTPAPAHVPLLRLFEKPSGVVWPDLSPGDQTEPWFVLRDERAGAAEQRRFVQIALRTPDFAFLEGPPGSGKTTAICELVLQLARQNKRVLLCASTHVAVDNVLERLDEHAQRDGSNLVPVRVGDPKKVSASARKYQLDSVVATERERLVKFLRSQPRSDARELLQRAVAGKGSAVERMVLDAANLVCGTTIGILNHPDIKAARAAAAGMFDVFILDEASKTTFQEFLVPALLARRWIVVGDPRQLSPFVDELAVAANLRAALPSEASRDACVDVFLAAVGRRGKKRNAIVAADQADVIETYRKQALPRAVIVAEAGAPEASLAQVVVGTPTELVARADALPLGPATVRGLEASVVDRRSRAALSAVEDEPDNLPRWEDELAWRYITIFELRQAGERGDAERLKRDVEALLPVGDARDPRAALARVDRVRRIAFPSMLESLQHGFERRDGAEETALTRGLPPDMFSTRHVLLAHQHRMHPEISAFAREHVYRGEALQDPPGMEDARVWDYPGYGHRAVWLDVESVPKHNRSNRAEAAAIVRELQRFCRWASVHPLSDSRGTR